MPAIVVVHWIWRWVVLALAHRNAAIFYVLSLMLIIAAIPCNRALP